MTMEGLRTSAGMDAVRADAEMNRMCMYSAAAMEGLFADEQMNRMCMYSAAAMEGVR